MKSIKKIIHICFILNFLLNCSTMVVMVVLPLYMNNILELSYHQIGLNYSLFSVALIFLEIPTGGLADFWGRKKTFILSIVLNLVAIGSLFIKKNWGVVLFQLLSGAARAIYSGSLDAWAVDEIKKIDKSMNLSKLFTCNMAASYAGSIISVLISTRLVSMCSLDESFLFISSYHLSFLLGFTILILVLFFSMYGIRDQKIAIGIIEAEKHTYREILKSSLKFTFKNKTLCILLFLTFVFGFVYGSVEMLWQSFFNNFMDGGEQFVYRVGYIGSAIYLIGLLGDGLLMLLQRKKLEPKILMFGGRFLFGISLFITSKALKLSSSIIFFNLIYFSYSLFAPIEDSIFNEEVPGKLRATIQSIKSNVSYIGTVIGTPLAGFIATCKGISFSWKILSLLFVASTLCILAIRKKKENLDDKMDNCC